MVATIPEYVDEEINKYLGLLSNLCVQKNSFLSIFYLPPEILVNVFTIAICNYHKSNDHPTFHVPHWVNVLYVCHHWCNVTLNYSMLWTYHFNVSPHWTEELLAGSEQASLKICIDCDYSRITSWWLHLVENISTHVEWAEELHLKVPSNVLPTEISLNAPHLQILNIYLQNCSFKHTLKINNGHSLPLYTLKLAECSLPWHSSFNLSVTPDPG